MKVLLDASRLKLQELLSLDASWQGDSQNIVRPRAF